MTVDEIKTVKEIVLAGYLHDIGKFAQRAGIEKYRSVEMEERLCPVHDGGWHSHQHVLYTEGVLQALRDVLPDEVNCANVIQFAANHHRPTTFEEWCVAEGDRLSSGMDRRDELELENEKDKKFYEKPLISLLSTLQIDDRPLPKTTYHKLEGLEPASMLGTESDKISKEEYARLWNSFECDFKKLQGLDYDDFVKALDALLLHYMWCIPSSTVNDADISLYQHSKTTASFASVLYRYHAENNDENEDSVQKRDVPKFRFINGDISGIQKYIFDLKSTDNSAKLLRAKSFELMALSDVLVKNLIRIVDGSLADIITTSGGKFMLVFPNTENANTVLKQKQKEYEAFFLREFAGKLSIIISDGTEACGNDLCGKDNVQKIINRIGYDGDCAKQKKMQKTLLENGHILENVYGNLQRFGECNCCETMPAQENNENCKNCEKLIEIGGKLVRSGFIKYKADKITHFGQMVDLLKCDEKSALSVNTFIVGKGQVNLPYIAPYNNGEDGELKTFEDIANDSENGNNKLAMFKADIDNLGLVFSSSLGKRMSFSRYADMSRMFHDFFSFYYAGFVEKKYKNKIYTVFSGGDDICVIGHWYDIMHFAADFHKELERLTNKNESITLSAGIALFSSNVPLKFVAHAAEQQLELSKTSERMENIDGKEKKVLKNAITVFDTTVSWEEYDECLSDGEKFKKALCSEDEKNNLPTALVYKLLDFSERVKNLKNGNVRDLMWKSNFRYMTARNLDKKDEKLKQWFCAFGADDEKMKKSKIAVSYGLYTQRKN